MTTAEQLEALAYRRGLADAFDEAAKALTEAEQRVLAKQYSDPNSFQETVNFNLRIHFANAIREAEAAGEARGRAMERERIKDALDFRLNDYLCEMREGYDDSIVGFNEAWDVVRKYFKSIRARTDKESSDD